MFIKKAILLPLLFASFVIPLVSLAQYSPETIHQMNVVIDVAKDGTLSVSETIIYDFGSQQRHGLLRIIPENTAPGGSGPISLENIQVLNEAGIPYPFTHTGSEIRVGDPEVTITGVHTYIVNYTVKNAVGFFKDYNEVYWNAIGTEWQVPIKEALITLRLPISNNTKPYTCYRGEYGGRGACNKALVTSDGQNTIYTFSEKNLGAHEGVTIAAAFSKGALFLNEPPEGVYTMRAIVHYGYYALPFILVIFLSVGRIFYSLRKKMFAASHALVPEYDADPYNPLETAALWKENITNRDFSAAIVRLAILGQIIIEEKEGNNYVFSRTKKESESLSPAESLLLLAIENHSTNSLANKFYIQKEKIVAAIEENISEKNRLVRKVLGMNSAPTLSKFDAVVYFFTFAYIWLSFFSFNYFIVVFVALLAIRRFALPPKKYHCTKDGFFAQRKLDGLYRYINVAEKDRILFHNSPEKNPETFEKLLPYAMVFKLEKKWAKEFENIYTVPPNWYSGAGGNAFNAVLFASNLNSFQRATSGMAAQPSSSDSSGGGGFSSGSSGGGFSGGGGGGGGGGSW